jgi:hypothetical protein
MAARVGTASAPSGVSNRICMRPDLWVQDHLVDNCEMCGVDFGFFVRRHHCRFCGHIFCGTCSDKTFPLADQPGGVKEEVRTCRKCFLFLATQKTTNQQSDRVVRQQEERKQRERSKLDRSLEVDLLTTKGYLRGTEMALETPLVAIGHRTPLEKSCYLVQTGGGRGRESILTLLTTPLPPTCPLVLSSKTARSHFRNFVREIDHPFIFRAQDVAFVKEKRKVLIFREFVPRGSLKDRLHRKANPKQQWAAKYGFKGEPLPERQIALFSKQILEGMAYFSALGLPCTGIHTGNIIMRDSNWCQISEFENAALGFTPFKPGRVHSSDVLAFGHILYEMAVGAALETAELVSLPNVPLPIQEILYRIFRPDAESEEVSVKTLLCTTFIAEARLSADHEDRLYIHKDQTKKLKKRLIYSAKEPKAGKGRGTYDSAECAWIPLPPLRLLRQPQRMLKQHKLIRCALHCCVRVLVAVQMRHRQYHS